MNGQQDSDTKPTTGSSSSSTISDGGRPQGLEGLAASPTQVAARLLDTASLPALLSLRNSVAGKKTYATCAILGVLLFGSWQNWWKLPPEIYQGLLTLAVCFVRAGLKREVGNLALPTNQTTKDT